MLLTATHLKHFVLGQLNGKRQHFFARLFELVFYFKQENHQLVEFFVQIASIHEKITFESLHFLAPSIIIQYTCIFKKKIIIKTGVKYDMKTQTLPDCVSY